MLVWRRATRLPTVMVRAASAQNSGPQTPYPPKKPTNTSSIRATNPPAFDATDRKAVTGVGAPSYVSGAQKWNGTALTLNAKPTSDKKMATATSASAPWCAKKSEMLPGPDNNVLPVTPKI